MIGRSSVLAAVFLGAFGVSAIAADTPLSEAATKAREARIAGDTVNWLALGRQALTLAPEHTDLLFSVARAEAATGNRDAALSLLGEAVRRGGGFDLATAKEFSPFASDARYKAIEAANARNLIPVARAALFAEVGDASLMPEGITYDARGRRFFIGSMRGELWQVGMDQKAELFVRDADLREVLGIKVDATRDLLWCASGVYPGTTGSDEKAGIGTTALRAYDLSTRVLMTGAELDERPAPHGFNDLAVARNGDVYVTDPSAQAIYRLAAGGKTFERFFGAADVTFANGLVLSADEATLYVANVEGISAVDLAKRTHTRLAVGPNMTVGSIDGLAMKDGALIGVQNSPNLARIVRLSLSADGRSVAKLEVLASRGLLDLGATTGVVVGDDFYVVASPFVPPAELPSAPRPRILKIPL
jgi:sugar lactone lactonase YvrE